jgi:hypothetical protein
MGQISPFYGASKTAEIQLKKVTYGLSLHSSVFYPATLGTLSLAQHGMAIDDDKLKSVFERFLSLFGPLS